MPTGMYSRMIGSSMSASRCCTSSIYPSFFAGSLMPNTQHGGSPSWWPRWYLALTMTLSLICTTDPGLQRPTTVTSIFHEQMSRKYWYHSTGCMKSPWWLAHHRPTSTSPSLADALPPRMCWLPAAVSGDSLSSETPILSLTPSFSPENTVCRTGRTRGASVEAHVPGNISPRLHSCCRPDQWVYSARRYQCRMNAYWSPNSAYIHFHCSFGPSCIRNIMC